MKLLDQKQIATEKTKQTSEEIKHGLALAKRIDELRIKKAKEERDIELWRSETLRHAEEQIKEAVVRRDTALQEAKDAEERRFKAQAPLDIQKERERNQKQLKANEETAKELLERETRTIAREAGIQVQESSLRSKESEVDEKNKLATDYLEEKKLEYDEVASLKAKWKEKKDRVELDAKEGNKALNKKAESLAILEKNLRNERESIEREKLAIAEEKLHIQSQQETLRAAWQRIQKLQAKN